ncbi:Zinc finger SWIM domain-containing protein 7, variant 3 [Basidiobolus ranarum]|uniref:Zinc finger SWIM domain-containing protein 7, variant 3 n=1 Tax=Basidiobolus ranarum TaxID=34480 RepID=A0ABR2WNG9_9FUNG
MVCPSKRKLYQVREYIALQQVIYSYSPFNTLQIADPEADEPVLYEYCTCSAFLREGTVSRLIGLFLSEYCYSCKFFKVVIYKRNTLVSLFFNPFR